MNHALGTAAIVASLVLAAWGGLTTALDRPPGRSHLVLSVVVEALLIAFAGAALVAMAGGERPGEPATFAGYLITTLAVPVTGAVLGKMEPTRWGSATIAFFNLIVPVLVVRLYQVWEATGG